MNSTKTNQENLDQEFPAFKQQLRSFILRITCSPTETDDLVQESYLKARDKLNTFRGDSSLKTWVFAIAANLAKDYLRSKKRWTEDVLDVCKKAALSNKDFFEEAMQIRHSSPQGHYEFKEHIAFCFTCLGKTLPLEQQLSLMLKDVYQFKVAEAAQILKLTEARIKYHLHEARQNMIRIFAHRCAIVNKNGVCHQCTELNGIFNPQQDAQVEKNKLKLARDAQNPDKEYLLNLRLEIIQGIDPFASNAAALQLHHLEHNRKVMENHLNS